MIVVILILIQIPAVQNFVKNKAISYLEDKIKTKVEIGKLSIDFPKQIVLEKVYFEDQQKDTLIAGDKIRVDISLLKLLSNTVEVNYLSLEGISANIYRKGIDTTFNFDYIIKAFASEQNQPVIKDTTPGMQFKIGRIEMNKIAATFKDDITGNDVYFYLGKFETSIDKFNPDLAEYAIKAIVVSDITAHINQYKPLVTPKPAVQVEAESNEPIQTKLDLGTLSFKNINVNYNNEISALNAELKIGELNTLFGKMDLSKLFVPLENIQLKDSYVKILFSKSNASKVAVKEVEKHAAAQANNPWRIELKNVSFANDEIKFDDNNNIALKSGLDYSHLYIKGLTINADSLNFTPDIYNGNISQVAFTEKSGFNLQKLHANFFYSDTVTRLENFLLQTDKTIIRDNIQLGYSSISTIADEPGEIFIDANLKQCKLAVKDILLFAPELQSNLKGNEQSIFSVNGSAKGFVKDIAIPGLEVNGLGSTAMQISGNIKGLPDTKKTYYNLQLSKFVTTKKDIESIAPKNSVPSSIRLPDKLFAKGYFKGTMEDFTTKLVVQTSNGIANVEGSVNTGGKKYSAKVLLNSVDLGYILMQEENIGKISLQADVKGSGFDYKTMTTKITARLLEGEIRKYNYKNLLLDASVAKGNAVVESSIRDPNISYLLHANADLKEKYPAVQMMLKLDTLDLYALHLVTDTLQMSGSMHADFASTDPDALQGNLKVYDLYLKQGNQKLSTDTLTLSALKAENGEEFITLNSEIANVEWNGNYKLTEVTQALEQTINKYYTVPGFKDTAFTPQQWQMNMLLHPSSPMIAAFMPEFKGSDTVRAKLLFNSEKNDLGFSLLAPKIKYGEQLIEQLTIDASAKNKELEYKIAANKIGHKGFQLYQTVLDGYIADNKITTSLLLRDQNQKASYHIAGTLNEVDNGIKFALDHDSLLLNYNIWHVSKNNFIQFDSSGIIANDFTISNKEQSFSIKSNPPVTSSPLEMTFNNFRISTLTDFAVQDSLMADGIINGTAIVKNPTVNPIFTSDIQVKDLSYKKDTLGDLSVKIDNETTNTFNANIKIEGNGNDIHLDGKYYTGEGKMDMKLNVVNLNLATTTPFSAGQLKTAGGSLKGKIDIAGTTDKPEVNGDLHFDNAFVVPALLGERFTLPNEKISVTSKGIAFDHFTVVDSAGNKAIINGDVLTTDFKNYQFAVDLNADDFSLINSTKADNQLFYGQLNVDAKIKVRGDLQTPAIDVKINANKSTDFTFVLPSEDPEVQSREGVVQFVDMDALKDSTRHIEFTDTLINTAALAGMDLSAIIETDTAALFTLVIDERSGDALKLKGKAVLAAGVDESGKLSLTGNYELEKGSYQLSFNFLKRKFDIQKGSVITWTGDPTSANVDITALYEIKAAPIDLVEPQLAGLSSTEINKYKQRIPIQVFLKMKGELLKPQITFEIALPADQKSKWDLVDAKLQQIGTDESELNKQVFALLLLGRFTGEDITQSAAGSTSNATLVRQSVSSILDDQLNKIAGNLIKGVDVNFDLNAEDDYSTGTQQTKTDLAVNVSKSLMNDRIKVTVGSNFALEGAGTNQNTSNIAGDVAVDYRLSKDGRYMLRAYRKNNYEGEVDGQVIETGLTFSITLDYDLFKELFKKEDKTVKQQKKEDKKEKKQEKKAPAGN